MIKLNTMREGILELNQDISEGNLIIKKYMVVSEEINYAGNFDNMLPVLDKIENETDVMISVYWGSKQRYFCVFDSKTIPFYMAIEKAESVTQAVFLIIVEFLKFNTINHDKGKTYMRLQR